VEELRLLDDAGRVMQIAPPIKSAGTFERSPRRLVHAMGVGARAMAAALDLAQR
jgi:hypothetical protein